MKFTIAFIGLLAITTSWAEKEKTEDEVKDKREAAGGYHGATHSYQAPSLGNDGASAISIGAGYSVGGAKPSYASYDGQGFSGSHSLSPESLAASGHATIQLAPITLQPSHGNIVGADLSQLMSQLQHQFDSGALTLQAPEGYGSSLQSEGHSGYSGQEQSIPQYAFTAPKQQYIIAEQTHPSVPSYAAGSKGLGSYSATGPVLFSPTDGKASTPTFNYAASSGGHSFGSGGISLGGKGYYYAGAADSIGEALGGGNSLGSSPYKSFGNAYVSSGKTTFKPSAYIGSSVQADSSHGTSALSNSYGSPSYGGASSLSGSHGALSLGSASHGISLSSGHGGHSLGSSGLSGHSLGSGSLGGHSLGASSLGGHSLGSGSFGGHSYSSGSLGDHSLSSEGHGISLGSGGLSGLSLSSGGHGSHGTLSLGLGGHGASYGGSHGGFGSGSSKYISNAYLPAKEGLGSLSSYSGLSSPPATSYGVPTAAHAASSHNPQYYKSQPSHSSFGSGSSSYRSPTSSFSSLKSYPKYSAGGYSSLSSPYGSSKEPLQGAYSENSYNTIKYSEELKSSPQ